MIYEFEQYRLDTGSYQLCLKGEPIAVEPLAFNLLVFLIEHRDRVICRDELLDELWKGKVVTDAALAARLKDARKAVGDSGSRQAVIKTVHGRGYQFVASVSAIDSSEPERVSSENPESPVDLSLPEDPSIAVLPFVNLSGDPGQAIFCDGLTDDIITNLSRVPELFVIARHSVQGYRSQDVDIERVGQEQGVRYVLEGSVQRGGDRIRVSAQLVDAISGRHLWAERFDSSEKNFLELQDEITYRIVIALQVTLTDGDQARLTAGGTHNLMAWENMHRAKRLIEGHVRDDVLEAMQLLRQAIEQDPDYASAWAFLGWAHWENYRWSWVSADEDSLTQAWDSAQRALAIDESNPDVFGLTSMLHLTRGEIAQAIEVIEAGVVAYPCHSFLLGMSAICYRSAGRLDDAFRRINRAIRLCPFYPPWHLMVLGSLYLLDGDAVRAIEILEVAVRRAPESNLSRVWLVVAQIEAGRPEQAQKTAADLLRADAGFSSKQWIDSLSFGDLSVSNWLAGRLAATSLPG